jgi:hypothetical protein
LSTNGWDTLYNQLVPNVHKYMLPITNFTMHNRYMQQEIMENCRECIDEKDLRLKRKRENVIANHASWFWLIEKVKNGPVSDMICLIPKIRHVDLFGDIFEAKDVTEFQQDYLSIFKLMVKHRPVKHDALLLKWREPDFLRKAIQVKNVEMVKFIAPKIKASQFSTETYVEMVEDFRKMAKKSGNKEILELVDSGSMILKNGKVVPKTL